jgi:IS4 transposase
MIAQEIMERFEQQSPVSVMARGTLEYVFPAGFLDQLFRETAESQREGDLLFSLVVETLSLAVTSVRKSTHAAYEARKERLGVSVQSLYNKLQGIETPVSRALVQRSAERLWPVMQELNARTKPLLPGYRVKIVDGSHLAATERRLKELHTKTAHSLPGFSLVVLDPQWRLVLDVYPCEDAYAQERSLLGELLESVAPGDLWIADRAYCTTEFLAGIVERKASFLIRQHATALVEKKLVGSRRRIGRCSTGVVYEQKLETRCGDTRLSFRRLTIELDEPTTDGETEINLVTNLPHNAIEPAELYLHRWTIENAFQELGQSLQGEIRTLCYPKAALLAFCVAVYTYNLLTTLKAAIAAAHEDIELADVSSYYLAEELSAVGGGLAIAIDSQWWTKTYAGLTARQLAKRLLTLARRLDPKRFRKRIRKTRNPRPKRRGDYRAHVSASRILSQRR